MVIWCYGSVIEYDQYAEVFRKIMTCASVHAHLGRSVQRKRWISLLICCCFCPPPFKQFLEIVGNMNFDEEPNHFKLIYLIGANPAIRVIKTIGATVLRSKTISVYIFPSSLAGKFCYIIC